MQIDQPIPSGRHILVDGHGANPDLLNSLERIEEALHVAIARGEVTLLKLASHAFNPQGITAFALLTESHIAIHTWPERGFFTADLYFCGGKIDAAVAALLEVLRPEEVKTTEVSRGGNATPRMVAA